MSGRRNDMPPMPSCHACGECCGPVSARRDEAKAVRRFCEDNGVRWEPDPASSLCGFLRTRPDGTRACAVYPVRPWACRAFGVIAEMPCSYHPEAIRASMPADEAVLRHLIKLEDGLLGEHFEPGYLERLHKVALGRSVKLR